MLVENGVQVGFGDIVAEGAVPEHAGGVADRGQLVVPADDTQRQGFDFVPADLFRQTGKEHTAADGMDGLAGNVPVFHGHAEVQAELEQQLVEQISLAAARFDVLNGIEQGLFQVVSVRLPGANVAGVEFEDAKTDVARKQRIVGFDLLTGTAETFLGNVGDSLQRAGRVGNGLG